MKLWQKIIIALAAIIGAAGYWLLADNRPSDGTAPLDIAALRTAANGIAGDKPLTLSVERAAAGLLPSNLLVAGGGFGSARQGVHAFAVNYKDGAVLIDTGFDTQTAKVMTFYKRDAGVQARVDTAIASAKAILVTHEHADHMGALLSHPNWPQIQTRALITNEQFDSQKQTEPAVWPKGSRAAFKPFAYSGIKAIAPGIAVMKAASHTPGSQIIFVKLASGREYLFMGDISSMERNWKELRARSRLLGDVLVGEDRGAVYSWLRAFAAASKANPNMVMVPTHDADAIDALVKAGVLRRGL